LRLSSQAIVRTWLTACLFARFSLSAYKHKAHPDSHGDTSEDRRHVDALSFINLKFDSAKIDGVFFRRVGDASVNESDGADDYQNDSDDYE